MGQFEKVTFSAFYCAGTERMSAIANLECFVAAPDGLGHRSRMKICMLLSAAAAWPMVLAGCTSHTEEPLNVVVRGPASACTITVDGRTATLDELQTLARPAAKAGRIVRIDSDMVDVPYRCIGGAIYTLQAAGFRDVGFVARPAGPRS